MLIGSQNVKLEYWHKCWTVWDFNLNVHSASLSALHTKWKTANTTTELLKLAVQNQLCTFCSHLTSIFSNFSQFMMANLIQSGSFFMGGLTLLEWTCEHKQRKSEIYLIISLKFFFVWRSTSFQWTCEHRTMEVYILYRELTPQCKSLIFSVPWVQGTLWALCFLQTAWILRYIYCNRTSNIQRTKLSPQPIK